MYRHVKVLQDSNKSIGKVHAASGISCSLYNATQEINEVDISQESTKKTLLSASVRNKCRGPLTTGRPRCGHSGNRRENLI
jgi:hypothetical protein